MNWIRVQKELPSPLITCLVSSDNIVFTAYMRGIDWYDECEEIRVYPTHWMHLPEPPTDNDF
jgi:hypothetical protein